MLNEMKSRFLSGQKKKSLFGLTFSILLIVLLTISCGKNGTTEPGPGDTEQADSLAQEAFALLNQAILEAEEPEDPQSGEDVFPEAAYNGIKGLFQQALALDEDNALANFGMGILEVASVNYDEDLWDLINEFTQDGGGKRLLKNQYSFLIKASQIQASYFLHALRGDDDLKFATLQNLIDNNVLPKLETALVYLEKAENIADTTFIPINTGEEILELDAGEICLFESSIYAVCAGFREITLYDVDILDENGSYDWLDSLQDDYDDWFIESEQIGDTLYIQKYWYYNEAVNDSIIISMLKDNLESREEFLAYRAGNSGTAIQTDLVAMIAKLELARDKILAETDEQDNDIIKIEYLNELDNDIADHDENDPNFMQDWNTFQDALDWLNELITGPVTFTEDFDDDGEDEQFTIDLSAYFDPGLTNMKDYLPYHEWNDAMHIVLVLDWQDEWENPNGNYSYWDENGEEHTFTNVYYIYWNEWECAVNEAIFFLNGPDGDPINLDEEMPYFPDYTFGGIFPGMTRDAWLSLFGGE
ncbi:MAG: hypothetical protein U9R23_00240 [Candidatus Cloacimonadota bacterium]|nr:hypothetical protein [Candidatus Cloacimonadota bacterium]